LKSLQTAMLLRKPRFGPEIASDNSTETPRARRSVVG